MKLLLHEKLQTTANVGGEQVLFQIDQNGNEETIDEAEAKLVKSEYGIPENEHGWKVELAQEQEPEPANAEQVRGEIDLVEVIEQLDVVLAQHFVEYLIYLEDDCRLDGLFGFLKQLRVCRQNWLQKKKYRKNVFKDLFCFCVISLFDSLPSYYRQEFCSRSTNQTYWMNTIRR